MFTTAKINALAYQKVLEKLILPFNTFEEEEIIFQPNNIHRIHNWL